MLLAAFVFAGSPFVVTEAALGQEPPVSRDETKGDDPQGGAGFFGPGLGGGGFGGMTGAMYLPQSAIPTKTYLASTNVIIAISDDRKRVFGYSEAVPRWEPYDLEQPLDLKNGPIVSTNVAVIVDKSVCLAYGSETGRWAAVSIEGEKSVHPTVGTSYAELTKKDGVYIFKNSWGRWFSDRDIKAGRVAELALKSGRDRTTATDPSDLRQRYEAAEAEIQRMARQMRLEASTVTDDRKKEQLQELRAAVGEAFKLRQRHLRIQLDESRRTLADLEQLVEQREMQSVDVITRRVNELLEKEAGSVPEVKREAPRLQ